MYILRATDTIVHTACNRHYCTYCVQQTLLYILHVTDTHVHTASNRHYCTYCVQQTLLYLLRATDTILCLISTTCAYDKIHITSCRSTFSNMFYPCLAIFRKNLITKERCSCRQDCRWLHIRRYSVEEGTSVEMFNDICTN